MNIADFAFNLVLQIVVDLALLFTGKYLYEESIKTDRINYILLILDILLSAVVYFPETQTVICQIIFGIISFVLLGTVFIRGERKKLLRRLIAYAEVSITFIMTIPTYCSAVYALINHVPEVKSPDEVYTDFVFDSPYKIYMLVICTIFLIYVYFQLVRKQMFLNLGWKTRVVMTAFSFYMIISGSVVLYLSENPSEMYADEMIKGLFAVSLTLICIVFPAFLIKTQTAAAFESGQKHHQEMLELETRHFQQYKERQDETRRFRHDIRNNLLTVQMLQRDGKDREAAEYIDELLGKVNELSPKVVTGSDMLDTIMSSKIEIMEQSGISVDIDGVFDQGLNMKSVDMCTVFANALDNAIEACEKAEGERSFEMRIKRTASFYVIAMKNTMSELNIRKSLIGTGRFTTKKNRSFHGYGLGNIKKTVEKYGGETTVSVENNMFLLNIIIPVTS